MSDLISRQAAQKLICEDGTRLEQDGVYELTMCAVKQWAVDLLDGLPSVEPERKPGKWIEKEDYSGDVYYDCSVCGNSWTTIDGTPWENGMNYCPSCGARMEVQNDS